MITVKATGMRFDEPCDNSNEIIPNLWMGAWPFYETTYDYHLIVCCADYPNYKITDNRTIVIWFKFDDSSLKTPPEEQLFWVVDQVVANIRAGKKTLVHCAAGINRSGLVTALSLVKMGWSPKDAIALLREKRGEVVLFNDLFERFIMKQENTNG